MLKAEGFKGGDGDDVISMERERERERERGEREREREREREENEREGERRENESRERTRERERERERDREGEREREEREEKKENEREREREKERERERERERAPCSWARVISLFHAQTERVETSFVFNWAQRTCLSIMGKVFIVVLIALILLNTTQAKGKRILLLNTYNFDSLHVDYSLNFLLCVMNEKRVGLL